METYKQDLTQKEDKGTIFMMQLLMEDACQMPQQSDIERVLKNISATIWNYAATVTRLRELPLQNTRQSMRRGM